MFSEEFVPHSPDRCSVSNSRWEFTFGHTCGTATEGQMSVRERDRGSSASWQQEDKAGKTKFDLGTELWPLLPEQQQLCAIRSRKLKSETVFRKCYFSIGS